LGVDEAEEEMSARWLEMAKGALANRKKSK